ncbi:hypothetical protein, partial [Arthrobacter sp. BPSS-3]|uniref:hypothetical protein n=1 Tax=Arthrobacter sp. BPSS-3 TaxID=3366580 RepID=UPI0037DC6C9B
KPHHRGGTIRQFQPINKTIGINKLGTLLSSQTTDTPGTTTTPFRAATRSGATFQTYPMSSSEANSIFSNQIQEMHQPRPKIVVIRMSKILVL